MNTNLTEQLPIGDLEKLAKYVVDSRLFGVKSVSEAVTLMALTQSEGIPAIRAVQLYHIIQGRPSMKSEAMLARFQAAGGSITWKTSTDKEASATLSHPAGGSLTVSWSLERAKSAGLGGKDNWKNYPAAMLRARVISEGVRAVYPGCVLGIYADEEVEDMPPQGKVVEISGTGVDALTQKVDALISTTDKVETISKDQAKTLVECLKTMGVEGNADVFQYIADNMEGLVVKKLSELTVEQYKQLMAHIEGDYRDDDGLVV